MSRKYKMPRPVGRPPIPLVKVAAIRALRKKGKSFRQIAHEVQVSHETARRYCFDLDTDSNSTTTTAPTH